MCWIIGDIGHRKTRWKETRRVDVRRVHLFVQTTACLIDCDVGKTSDHVHVRLVRSCCNVRGGQQLAGCQGRCLGTHLRVVRHLLKGAVKVPAACASVTGALSFMARYHSWRVIIHGALSFILMNGIDRQCPPSSHPPPPKEP